VTRGRHVPMEALQERGKQRAKPALQARFLMPACWGSALARFATRGTSARTGRSLCRRVRPVLLQHIVEQQCVRRACKGRTLLAERASVCPAKRVTLARMARGRRACLARMPRQLGQRAEPVQQEASAPRVGRLSPWHAQRAIGLVLAHRTACFAWQAASHPAEQLIAQLARTAGTRSIMPPPAFLVRQAASVQTVGIPTLVCTFDVVQHFRSS
jgi:hypothetical protein